MSPNAATASVFATRIAAMSRAANMLKDLQVRLQGGHLVGEEIMLTVSLADFDRLVELGRLKDVTIKKTCPSGQISYHMTAVNEGVMVAVPEVRVMAISITPAPVSKRSGP